MSSQLQRNHFNQLLRETVHINFTKPIKGLGKSKFGRIAQISCFLQILNRLPVKYIFTKKKTILKNLFYNR